MKKKTWILLLFSILLIGLFATGVSAQIGDSLSKFGEVFQELFENYNSYYFFWDSVLLFALFLSAFTLGKKGAEKWTSWGKDQKASNSAIVVLALIAALGTSFTLKGLDIKLLTFAGPIASMVIIALVMFGLIAMIWKWTEGDQAKRYRWGLTAFTLLVGISMMRTQLEGPVLGFSFFEKFPLLSTGLFLVQAVCAVGSIWGLITFGRDMFYGVSQPITDEQLETLRKKGISNVEYKRIKNMKEAGESEVKWERDLYKDSRLAMKKIRDAEAIVLELAAAAREGKSLNPLEASEGEKKQAKNEIRRSIRKLKELETAIAAYMGSIKNLEAHFENLEGESGANVAKAKALGNTLLARQKYLNDMMEICIQSLGVQDWWGEAFIDTTRTPNENFASVWDFWVRKVKELDEFFKDLTVDVAGIDVQVSKMRVDCLRDHQTRVQQIREGLSSEPTPTPTSSSSSP